MPRPGAVLLLLTLMAVPFAHAGNDTAAATQPGGLRWSTTLSAPRTGPDGDSPLATPLPQLLDAAARQAAANRAADASVLAAQAQSQQAWATAWMPRLDANASSTRQKQINNGLDINTPASSVALQATLPVWRASERATARAQEAAAAQSEWQARNQRASIARDLSLAYVAAAEATEQQRLAEAQQELLQSQLHINDRRLQAGVGTVLDQLETRTRLDQLRATIQEWRMRAATQRVTLERLCGQTVQIPAGFSAGATDLPDTLPALSEALEIATAANPQLQDARAEVAAAKATTAARDAEFWEPTVDALAAASRARQTQSFEGISDKQNVTTRSLGVQLNWPLFTGGYQLGRTREAAALLARSQAHQDQALTEVQAGLRDAYQSLAQARAMMSAHRDVEQTATATFEAVQKAFVAGMRTNLDLLNAQQQIFSARQSLVSARVTALNAHIQILALLDRLDAPHVGPLLSQFDSGSGLHGLTH